MTDAANAGRRLRDRLATDLAAAMADREPVRVRVLRTLTGAIDNAEAVDAGHRAGRGAPLGSAFGSAEAPRLALDGTAVMRLLDAELAERREGVDIYRRAGREDEVTRLQAQCSLIATCRNARRPVARLPCPGDRATPAALATPGPVEPG